MRGVGGEREGEGVGVSQRVILHDKGGGAFQTHPKKNDRICEQPQMSFFL